jgi:Thymidylate synthase complementing protein
MAHKHWSPFEMVNLVLEINTTRSISAQILRHRSFSFQEFCLAGDARITVRAPGGTWQRVPIAEIYRMWGSNKFRARMARAYDPALGRFIEAPVGSVYASGRKPVYEFTIQAPSSTRAIRCTREHRVLTRERGFVPFGEAFDDVLTVALNGAPAEALPYQRREVLEAGAWMGSERFAREHGIASVTARKWFRHHGVKPEKPNHYAASAVDADFAARLQSFMKWARSEVRAKHCGECNHDGSVSRLELSHIIAHDGNPVLAFDPGNLRTLCAGCHRRHDTEEQGKRYGWSLAMTAKWGRITGQEFLGVQDTYDIEMDHPTHNFVADGVVVHNSTRYAEPGELPPVGLPRLRTQDTKNRQASHDNLAPGVRAYLEARIADYHKRGAYLYADLIAEGVAKECAREILPLGTPTRLYVNGTARSWLHYLMVRTGPETQAEHRAVALAAWECFRQAFPTIAEAARAGCPNLAAL